jgi:hypothetical protein
VFAGLLNKGFRGSLALLIIIGLVTFILNYFSTHPIENEYYPNLFYNYFTNSITGKFTISAINFVFIAIGVLLVSLISVNQEVVEKQNYFPVFLYLLICVVSVSPFQVNSQILTNVFVLFAVYRLLDIYRKEDVLRQIFEASFWLSVSTFFTVSSVISFPLFFIILLILRPFYWREWSIALLGFFIPIFIYECMAYLCNFNQWYFIDSVELYFKSMKSPTFSEYYMPFIAALLLLFIISFASGLAQGFGNTVKKQKTKAILLWYLFFSTFGFFAGGTVSSSILLIYSFPIAFFIGDFLYGIKQIKFTNTILTLLLLCASIIYLSRLGAI